VAGGPFIATFAAGTLVYNASATVVRNLRELSDEEDGDVYFVYYPLDNAWSAADYLLPEISITDVIGSAFNIKIKHCVAWFSTSSSTYVTIEITSDRVVGVEAQKRSPALDDNYL
jgi:hypothetical protein